MYLRVVNRANIQFMQAPLLLITLLVIQYSLLIAFCLWLSLRILGLKPGRINIGRIIGYEVVFLVVIGLISFFIGGDTGLLFLLLVSNIGGVVVWAILLKKFAPHWYSIGRVVASWIISNIFASIFTAIVTLIGVSSFAQVFIINGNSMAPSLKENQRVLVYKFNRQPNNNAIIVYKNSEGTQALGRVHGLPGQPVAIESGRVEVEGEVKEVSSFTLGEGQYYVIADNEDYKIPRVIETDNIIGVVGPRL